APWRIATREVGRCSCEEEVERGRLVREPLPSRQRCSCEETRSADETSAPLRWGADVLVREPLPSRQRCPCEETRSADEASAPHLEVRGSCERTRNSGRGVRTPEVGRGRLVREPLPSRQRCSCEQTRSADETSTPPSRGSRRRAPVPSGRATPPNRTRPSRTGSRRNA